LTGEPSNSTRLVRPNRLLPTRACWISALPALPFLEDCLAVTSPADPGASGSFAVEFKVGAGGRGKDPVVQRSTLAETEATDCVTRMIEHLKFPAPVATDPVSVTASSTLSVDSGP
jgi:hypothetical protein